MRHARLLVLARAARTAGDLVLGRGGRRDRVARAAIVTCEVCHHRPATGAWSNGDQTAAVCRRCSAYLTRLACAGYYVTLEEQEPESTPADEGRLMFYRFLAASGRLNEGDEGTEAEVEAMRRKG